MDQTLSMHWLRRLQALALTLSLGIVPSVQALMQSTAMPLVLSADATRAACDCLCVDGTATTLCRTIAAAQQGGSLCAAAPPCPIPAGGRASSRGTALVSPSVNARDCRVVALWDRQLEAYRQANICDVEPVLP